MGLADYMLDVDKVADVKFEGATVQVKHIDRSKMNVFVESKMPMMPDTDDDELRVEYAEQRKALREKLFYEYVARHAVVGWDDEDIPYSEETAVAMLTSAEGRPLADIVAGKAMQSTDFRMARDQAIKKFAPNLSEDSASGTASG
jgi:hypothetical protein